MAVLQKIAGGRAGEWIQLSRGTIRIGRSEGSNLRLTPAAASKSHATIECFESHCEVTDLNSRNGLRVNGVATTDQLLWPGDRISIADQFHFVLQEVARPNKRWPVWLIVFASVLAILIVAAASYWMR